LVPKRFRSIKNEIRVLGIDDGRFVPHTKGTADIVGVVYRGGYWFEGVMCTDITIDGMDATEKLVAMVKNSPYYGELRVIEVDLPVVSVAREKPDLEEIRSALKNLPDFEKRWQGMLNAGELFEVETRNGENPVYVQTAGILREDAIKILKRTSTRSNIPEALRVAHIIASGLSLSIEKV
jgi:endonuclease V-like protein UPF0215 family